MHPVSWPYHSVRSTRTSPVQLFLQVADQGGMTWADEMVKTFHYLKKAPHTRMKRMTYLLLQGTETQQERVGCLIFTRPQCTYVKGWYGSLSQQQEGKCPFYLYELINLARVWLSPRLQDRQGAAYVYNAASRVVAEALRHIPVDYLLLNPPPFLDRPWQLRQCLSYCDTTYHLCTLYLAANFREQRRNEKGLITYVRDLRGLTRQEEDLIREASRLHPKNRRLRAERRVAEEYTFPPLLRRLHPVPLEWLPPRRHDASYQSNQEVA